MTRGFSHISSFCFITYIHGQFLLNPLSFSFSTVFLSSRKSNLLPTRIIGVVFKYSRTSLNHFSLTFSKLADSTRENEIITTSVWGYESHIGTFWLFPTFNYDRNFWHTKFLVVRHFIFVNWVYFWWFVNWEVPKNRLRSW